MARPVFYEIRSHRDGTLSALVTIEPNREYVCGGFESFADVMRWVDGLRVLMDACGAPLSPLDTPGDVRQVLPAQLPEQLNLCRSQP